MPTSLRRLLATIALGLACALPAAAQPVPGEAGLVYARVGNGELSLDLYAPRIRLTPRPVVVWLHGGDWTSGSRRVLPEYLNPLLAEGYAVAAVSYRLGGEAGAYGSEGVTFPGPLHDVKAAVRFLRARAGDYGLAPERIIVWGEGAGGHLAALLGTTADRPELEGSLGDHQDVSSRVLGVIAYGAPSDLLQLGPDAAAAGLSFDHDGPGAPGARLLGFDRPGQGLGELRRNAASALSPYPLYRGLARDASPAASADAGDAPFLIVSGTRDRFAPPAQGQRLNAALLAAGVAAQYKQVEAESAADFGAEIHALAREYARSLVGDARVPIGDPRGLTGAWFDPATSGQGFDLYWVEGDRLVVNFFGHRDDGSNLALFGLHEGRLRYATALEIPMIVATNGRFNGLDPAAIRRESWGTLTLEFSGCDRAYARLEGRDGRQFLSLQKLAGPPGRRCD